MKVHYCLLQKFNNYFNRKIIKYDTVDDYDDNAADSFIPEDAQGHLLPFDFNPNDNVTTEIYVNDLPFSPDYLLILNGDSEIVSRWFVIEEKRNRQGQWTYYLKRDVIADNINVLANAPVYVQKAWLEDGNPLLLNSEGMNFNRIKTSETPLKDFSGSAWYVAYLSKTLGGASVGPVQITTGEVEGAVTLGSIATDLGVTEAFLISLLNFNGDRTTLAQFTNRVNMGFNVAATYPMIRDQVCSVGWNADFDITSFTKANWNDVDADYRPLYYLIMNIYASGANTELLDNFALAVEAHKAAMPSLMATISGTTYLTTTHLNKLKKLENDGTIIQYLGKYYNLRVSVSGTSGRFLDANFSAQKYALLQTIAQEAISALSTRYTFNSTNGEFLNVGVTSDDAFIQLNEISDTVGVSNISATLSSSRKLTADQQYDIICLPADNIDFYLKDQDNVVFSFTSMGDICRKIITKLALDENANIYDIQLLPYCPLSDIFNLYELTEHEDYDLILDDSSPAEQKGVIFYVKSASFSQRLSYSLSIKESMKIDNECDMYRIIAPNYQGSFEFNVAKNGGSVDYFTAYCTYKPYTPFIKVAPNFNYLYGIDFNDNRGLICAGDFSMGQISSAWESYQLQNKNYQNIFNREIQNLEFNQGIETRQASISGGVGIFTDAIKGGVAGGMVTGSPYGAAAGAILGGATSAFGYVQDMSLLAAQHREQRSYAVDKFNYTLGNIKALPYSLTKIGAFDISSKIFPVLEYYTCTEEEKEALRMKLRYESMTVMVIDEFGNYFHDVDNLKYFKGELIRCDDIADDTHMLEAIYAELLKGVYI